MSPARRLATAIERAAVGGVLAALVTAALVSGAVATGAPAAAAPPVPIEPLEVTIETLTPGEVPAVGSIEVSGTVTNVDDETWTTVNLYPLIGDTPMTTPIELRRARRGDPLAFVGERVTDPGPYAIIDRLEPGQSTTYSFTVARSRLDVSERGVYWFGVHALGQDTAGRDSVADGRARTFLPLVSEPPSEGRRPDGATARGTVPVAVVVPLRRRILHEPDGSLADPGTWGDLLGSSGPLGRLVRAGDLADGAPLTWLVDPALTEAAARLAAGNPGRSIAATLSAGEGDDPDATGSPTPSDPDEGDPDASPDASPDPGSEAGSDAGSGPGDAEPQLPPVEGSGGPVVPGAVDPDELDPAARAVARSATGWLDALAEAVSEDQQVLALPFGDLDVAGAAERSPALYEQARRRAGDTLAPLGIDTEPALSSPLGYVDVPALTLADPDETVLMTDLEVGLDAEGRSPALVTVAGRDVVVSSSGAAQGGPGPGRRLSAVSLRQRILSEAALRLLEDEPQPLVVVLPAGWSPDDPGEFLPLLDTSWVDLDTVSEAVAGLDPVDLEADELVYPDAQQSSEIGPAVVEAVEEQVRTGRVLDDVLPLNDRIGDVVAGEAFAAASYTTRQVRGRATAAMESATAFVDTLLGRIEVTTPTGVTLSSTSGRLPATIVNGLTEPISVRLDAASDLPMSLTVPDTIEVPAEGRIGVLLEASTQRQGIHNVTLMVTSPAGVPLGGRADLPIRASQVSGVIWLIIGSGAVLLFGMIGLRLVRRVRAARRLARQGGASAQAPGTAGAAG